MFGPVERSYRQDMPKKMRRLAMIGSLTSRVADGAVLALDELSVGEARTKEMSLSLQKIGVVRDVVIVDEHFDANVSLAARNIPGVELREVSDLNVLDVLGPAHLVFTKAALEGIEKRLERQKA